MALDKALKKFGEELVDRARRNLGAYRTVIDSKGRRKRRRADATGDLRKSLDFRIKKTRNGYQIFGTSSMDYANFVEYGVNGTGRNQGAPFSFKSGKKSIPTSVLLGNDGWLKRKRIRVREWKDGKLGGFAKATPSRINSMAFLIARSIHRTGIAPLRYFNEAAEDTIKIYGSNLANAIVEDEMDKL